MYLMLLLLTVIFPRGNTIFVPSQYFQPLEFAIRGHFLPKLVLHPASDNEHQLFCLPVHFGGLGISNPVLTSDE